MVGFQQQFYAHTNKDAFQLRPADITLVTEANGKKNLMNDLFDQSCSLCFFYSKMEEKNCVWMKDRYKSICVFAYIRFLVYAEADLGNFWVFRDQEQRVSQLTSSFSRQHKL